MMLLMGYITISIRAKAKTVYQKTKYASNVTLDNSTCIL